VRGQRGWWTALQLCLAGVLVLTGMTVAVAGSTVTGLVLLAVGAAWLRRCYRLL
jgi:MYXO-CTERM domain-containing protein